MDPPVELPDKLYFKIGEVSRLLDVQAHVLRYWEQEFPMLRPHKSRGGQRLYRRADVELLIRIKDLLRGRKFTIAGARKQLIRERLASRKETEPPETTDDDATPDAQEVARLRDELELTKQERQLSSRARATLSRRLEVQRQVLLEVRKELADLVEAIESTTKEE